MAGKMIRVLEKTLFANLGDSLVASGTAKVWVATNVDISGYLYGVLVLRVHSWPTATGAPSLALSGYASAPTAEDPGTTFRGNLVLDGGATNSKVGFSAGVAGSIGTAAANFGSLALAGTGAPGFLDILLTLTQGSTASASCVFTVSGDLILRS